MIANNQPIAEHILTLSRSAGLRHGDRTSWIERPPVIWQKGFRQMNVATRERSLWFSGLNDRPHPGPLLQEREETLPVFWQKPATGWTKDVIGRRQARPKKSSPWGRGYGEEQALKPIERASLWVALASLICRRATINLSTMSIPGPQTRSGVHPPKVPISIHARPDWQSRCGSQIRARLRFK